MTTTVPVRRYGSHTYTHIYIYYFHSNISLVYYLYTIVTQHDVCDITVPNRLFIIQSRTCVTLARVVVESGWSAGEIRCHRFIKIVGAAQMSFHLCLWTMCSLDSGMNIGPVSLLSEQKSIQMKWDVNKSVNKTHPKDAQLTDVGGSQVDHSQAIASCTLWLRCGSICVQPLKIWPTELAQSSRLSVDPMRCSHECNRTK